MKGLVRRATLISFVFGWACASVRPSLPVPDHRAAIGGALRVADAHGALDACVDNLEHFGADRRRLFDALGGRSREGDAVAILELADVAELRYGYAAVVGGTAIQGLLSGAFRRRPIPRGLDRALASLSVEEARAFRSDERAAHELRDGSCFFVSLRVRGEWHSFGVYMPHWRAEVWATRERELVRELVPLLEVKGAHAPGHAAP